MKITTLKLVNLVPTLILIVACSQETERFTTQDASKFRSSLQGKVVDRIGPLANVLVTLNPGSRTAVSDSSGEYTFDDFPTGTYSVSFLKKDYRDTLLSDSIEIGLGEDQSIPSMKLRYRYANVKGTVVDSNDDVLADAGISVQDQYAETSSDASGKYTLTLVEPGKTRLIGVAEGIGYGYADVNLYSDSLLQNVEITLDQRGGVLKATVVNSLGAALPQLDVEAFDGILNTKTHNNGEFLLTEFPKEGRHRIKIGNSQAQTFVSGIQLNSEDTLSLGTIVLESVPSKPLIVAHSFHITSTADTSMLIMPWSSVADSVYPTWYYWSFNNGSSWTTTTEPRLKLIPSKQKWIAGSHIMQVRCMTADSVMSNTAKLTVLVASSVSLP